MDWDLIEEIGGEEELQNLMGAFYDRLFEDLMIGYFFEGKDKARLIEFQIDYVYAHLGNRKGIYRGEPIRKAHKNLAILPGHFDRRHQILKEILEEFEVSARVREAWLELDQAMRPLVLRQGGDVWQKKVDPRDEEPS